MDFTEYAQELIRHRDRRSAALIVVREVDSTNLLARRIADEYRSEGARVPEVDLVAWKQLAGRGRQGRRWSSPAGGGVYATLIRSLSDRRQLAALPLAVGVAVCETANAYLAGRCRLKWPNDLVVGDRKLGGILIEAVAQEKGGALAVIGLGVNYGRDLAAFGEPRATSLAHEAANPPAATPSLATVARELMAAVDAGRGGELRPEAISARYQALSAHRPGDRLACAQGSELVEGTFRGFDPRGFLRLESATGERLLAAGEILNDE